MFGNSSRSRTNSKMVQVPNYNEEVIYLTGRVATVNQPTQLLLEVRFSKGAQSVKAFARSERPDVGQLLFDVLPSLLSAKTEQHGVGIVP